MSETTAKRQRRARMEIHTDTKTVTFTLFGANGAPTDKTFTADLKKLPPAMVDMLALDRLRNKLMDSYSDPASDVLAQCASTYNTLLAGNWAASTKGDGADRTTDFVTAYAAFHKLDVDVARGKINAVEIGDDADKKATLNAWKKHPPIVAHMHRISAERAAARASASATAARATPAAKLAAI